MDGQVLFEGKIRYHISGMRIAIFLLMALLVGVVMFLTGIAGALDGFILGMLTVFVGLPTVLFAADNGFPLFGCKKTAAAAIFGCGAVGECLCTDRAAERCANSAGTDQRSGNRT